mmetsp:Transcript_4814/g.7125  ORF Transcript_4814/g.7125 Transcript_4814/m.7125 type:complete len:238 (-) Transcript_4814:1598-2311(-)
MPSAMDLLDEAIADLEAKLNISPGAEVPTTSGGGKKKDSAPKKKKEKKQQQQKQKPPKQKGGPANVDQPDICKLEFKVGVITKVWVHPDADKLYCEEIDVGEDAPRQIASGLRPHYSEEGMLGRRLLVVSNLKAKNLVGFKSHGMVLCAAETKEDGTELVEFIEPPEGAPLGEVVTFEGLPTPEPFSGAQVDKKKVFQACVAGMKTTEEGCAAWNGHVFMTSAGPCKSTSVKNGAMR